jgi:hypothetical protein
METSVSTQTLEAAGNALDGSTVFAGYGISAAARLIGCCEESIRRLDRKKVVQIARDSAGRRILTLAQIQFLKARLRARA